MENIVENNLICGIEKSKIRTAYFTNKMAKILADVQAKEEISENDLDELKNFLYSLRDKEKKTMEDFKDVVPEFSNRIVLDGLSKSKENEESSEEKNRRLNSLNRINNIMLQIAESYRTGNNVPNQQDLMEKAFELNGLSYYLDEECLFWEQRYKKKIVKFESMGRQRKTAEEYAKTTVEYKNYKRLANIRARVKSAIMAGMKFYKSF
jgi:hypothetical protein